MFWLRRPSREDLERVLQQARTDAPTFGPLGATRSSAPVAGFRYDTYAGAVGRGDSDWDAARDGLRAWAAHAGAGVSITPSDAPLAIDETVVGALALGPLHILIPARIVYVVDEPDRFGFAYVTLPGHPECGEEAFMLTRAADGEITFTMSAHSQHAELLTRLGGPVSRVVQRRANNQYIAGLRSFVKRQRRE